MKVTTWLVDRLDPDVATVTHEETCDHFELQVLTLKFYRERWSEVPYLVTRNWHYFTVEETAPSTPEGT